MSEEAAVLEGDAATTRAPAQRIPFCVVYDIRDGRVAAMRLYGGIEAAV